ncbi:MAG: helicase-related protein [Myxococcota bacterium]|nr:helicase-related protein [Myxococcota bacterium]
MKLPIDALREEVLDAVERAPLVLAAPTGSGKSTQVPRWLPGRVVVVEPRRVACRSLAARVAELEGVPLGEDVGYVVRDDVRAGADTRVRFVTPGVALRDLEALERADHVVLDELHERRLDVDLLLGLLAKRGRGLTVMSATLDGERVAAHLGGRYLEGTGRLHPVDVRYLGSGAALPSAKYLPERVAQALARAASDPGDVLVFLPGRAEIAACADAIRGPLEVIPLHGGLSLDEQSRAFRRTERRKVVLATNVAETSVTLPGIGVVIDAGLVRRTRYHKGRGHLTLSPIAMDSAEQRAGRAGRTGPGVAYRLWSEAAILEPRTPPEVHRESLVPMVLAAAATGRSLRELPLLDPPKDYALEAAESELGALGALDDAGALTPLGRELFSQPLDAPHARLLIEAQKEPALLGDVIDLVSALAVGRPLFSWRPDDPADDLRESGCDVVAILRAMREGEPRTHGLNAWALGEARRNAKRLRRAHGVSREEGPIDRRALALLFLKADPRLAHVARRRKRHVAFSNGGTEVELGRESAAKAAEEKLEALLALDERAIGIGQRDTRVFVTCAMPAPIVWLRDAGLGRDRLAGVKLERRKVVATIERVYARKVLDAREETPRGELARRAVARLILEGRILRGAREAIEARLQQRALAQRLAAAGFEVSGVPLQVDDAPVPTPEAHLRDRIAELGLETGEDVALLSVDDVLPEPLEAWIAALLDERYPRKVDLGDASYEVDYDLDRRQALLRMVRGTRSKPPPLSYLPKLEGFRICVETRSGIHVVRAR